MGEIVLTIQIAGKSLNIRVDETEENIIKQAVAMIEKDLNEFAKQSGNTDKLTLLSMIVLQNTSKMLKNEKNSTVDDTQIKTKLIEFDKLLTNALVSGTSS